MENTHKFQVNLGGMIDILSNHLYDSKDVYIRELLQNATDAIRARKKIEVDFHGEIHVELSKNSESATIIFSDNGIGLTEEEVHRFLATIANSSKGAKTFQPEENDYIGRFGIGLLSCFIVSSEIVMITTSAKNGKTTEWLGNADGTYQVKELESAGREPGTIVYLRALPEILEEESCFEKRVLIETLEKYGAAIEIPIYMENDVALNHWTKEFANKEQLFLKPKEEILLFGKQILNQEFRDYFFLENETGDTFGIAYIIPYTVQLSAQKAHTVFLNRMFVTSQMDVILPKWAFFTKAILFTTELQPVASRESFYKNECLDRTAISLGEALKEGLKGLSGHALERIISTHYLAFKAISTEDDELLRFIYPYLPFRTLNGEETLETLMNQSKTIYYTHSVDDFRQIRDLARNRGLTLINGGYTYDAALLSRLARLPELGIQLEALEPEQLTDDLMLPPAPFLQKSQALLAKINEQMQEYKVEIEIRQFQPEDLPMLFINPMLTQTHKELERAAEESNPLFSDLLNHIKQDEVVPLTKLFLNYSNPLVQKLFTEDKSLDSLVAIFKMLYIQALLLGHYPLKRKEMRLMNTNYLKILDML